MYIISCLILSKYEYLQVQPVRVGGAGGFRCLADAVESLVT